MVEEEWGNDEKEREREKREINSRFPTTSLS
jgi:hypothetical protein